MALLKAEVAARALAELTELGEKIRADEESRVKAERRQVAEALKQRADARQ